MCIRDSLFSALRDNVDTDLNLLDVLALARLGIELKREDIHSRVFDFQMAQPYTTAGGAAVLFPHKTPHLQAVCPILDAPGVITSTAVSYTNLRPHPTLPDFLCRLLL